MVDNLISAFSLFNDHVKSVAWMWHVPELPVRMFCCLVCRWRGAPSHPATARAWHPGRRQLSWNPRDEATSGRGHEEAGVSGTRYGHKSALTFTFQPLIYRQGFQQNLAAKLFLKYVNTLWWLIGVVLFAFCLHCLDCPLLQMQIIYFSTIYSRNKSACSDFKVKFPALVWLLYFMRR